MLRTHTHPPFEYCCRLTKTLMAEPVIAADGYTYEKSAIEQQIKEKGAISPVTSKPLSHTDLLLNQGLKESIQKYVEKNKALYEQQCIAAIKAADIETLLYLEKLGMNIFMVDEKGWTGLHHSVYRGSQAEAERWLSKGINKNTNSAALTGLYSPPEIIEHIKSLEEEILQLEKQRDILKENIKQYDEQKKKYAVKKERLIKKRDDLIKELQEIYPYTRVKTYTDYCYASGRTRPALNYGIAQYRPEYSKGAEEAYEYFKAHQLPGYIKQEKNSANKRDKKNRALEKITNLCKEVEAKLEQAPSEIELISKKMLKLQERLEYKKQTFSQKSNYQHKLLTPLHLAVYQEDIPMIKFLLKCGVDINLPDEQGATPLFWAVYRNNLPLINLLAEQGANLQALDNNDNSLLHAAAQYASQDIISYLLEKGFYYLSTNKKNEPPCTIAFQYDRPEIAAFIGKKGREEVQSAFFRIKLYKTNVYPPAVTASPTLFAQAPSASHVLIKSVEKTNIPDRLNPPAISYNIAYKDLSFCQELGHGGFGVVYKGAYRGNVVAIKQLMNQDLSEILIENFKQELTIMMQLSSPYIVKFVGACLESPHYSLVMEYLPRGNLYHFLQTPEEINWQSRYQIGVDIGHGVTYLHCQGIIHGDLKSLNILLDENYRAKIADFGLAKIKISSSVSTILGGLKGGSLRWMAPELLSDEEEASNTKASDMYSYGMILWELGARQIPYANKSNPQVLAAKLRGKHETIAKDTPIAMATLIHLCWQEKEKRPIISEAVVELEKEQKLLYK